MLYAELLDKGNWLLSNVIPVEMAHCQERSRFFPPSPSYPSLPRNESPHVRFTGTALSEFRKTILDYEQKKAFCGPKAKIKIVYGEHVYQDGTGFLPHSDLQAALKVLGIDIPGYKEEVAFSNWINSNLSDDPDLKRKLVNLAVAGTIHEKAINKKNLNTYTKLENLTLALMSAQIGLFNQIDLQHCPGLFRLLKEGETLDDLRKLSPEEILMRWVNYHMENANVNRRLTNFTTDINDSEIYTHLLHQIAPNGYGVTLSPLSVK
ncbi:hypothetical protein TELCIR_12559, partial [Teladorsagia circumcincta]